MEFPVLTEILIVVLLTILNGVLSMSELAVVSSRPVRLRILAEQGSKGAATAIRLAEDPGRFLSTVQLASHWSASFLAPSPAQRSAPA